MKIKQMDCIFHDKNCCCQFCKGTKWGYNQALKDIIEKISIHSCCFNEHDVHIHREKFDEIIEGLKKDA